MPAASASRRASRRLPSAPKVTSVRALNHEAVVGVFWRLVVGRGVVVGRSPCLVLVGECCIDDGPRLSNELGR
jgi:hypothetical protein